MDSRFMTFDQPSHLVPLVALLTAALGLTEDEARIIAGG